MDRDEVVTRLERIGLAPTARVDPAATIRGDAARPNDTRRELPIISVDFRLAEPSASSASTADGTKPRDLEVRGLLGEGGMGRVYVARQHSLDRDVAIKSLRDEADERQRRALLDEGAIIGRLEHPGIVPVHALGVDADGRPVLVMKRVEGVAWSELLRDPHHSMWASRAAHPDRRIEEHLDILMQVCSAVHFAHSRQIVHRDIKPQNVLIGSFGDVYLADWGIAKRLRDGPETELCGTPSYMAPEMIMGGPIDERTDVYLLGATLHEILSGTAKHQGATPADVLMAALLSEPSTYDARVPAALAAIANKATMKRPDDRFRDAAALRQALVDYRRHQSSMALVEAAAPRLAKLGEVTDQRLADQWIAEARFGLQQALDQWAENDVAKSRLDELDAILEKRRARAAELEALARDLDPTSGRRQRIWGQVAFAIVGVGLSFSAFVRGTTYEPSGAELVKQSLAPVIVVVVGALVMGRRLMQTAFNRRVVLAAATSVIAVAVSRFLGTRGGASTAQMLAHDSLIIAIVSLLTASNATMGGLRFVALIMFGTTAACACAPERAFFAFSLGTGVSLLYCVFLTARLEPPKK